MTAERGRQPNDHVPKAMITEVLLNMFRKRVAIMLVVCLLVSLVTVTGVMKSKATDATVTIDFTKQNYTNAQDVTTVTGGDGLVSISFNKGTGSNSPKYYTGDNTVRVYTNNTFTVSAAEGEVITKISIAFVGTYTGTWNYGNIGSYTSPVWTGSSNSVTFKNTGSQARMQSMTITIGAGGATPTPVPSPTTPEEIWDMISDHTLSSYDCELTGVVKYMVTPYTSQNGFISLYIVVDGLENKPFECFKMVNDPEKINAGEGIEVVKINDTITVSGTVKLYGGTVEFDQGCKLKDLVIGGEPEIPTYDTAEEIWDAANALPNNALLPGGPYELTGVVTDIATVYNSNTGKITVDIVVDDLNDNPFRCFQMINGTGFESDQGVAVLAVGDTIKVKGEITHYNTYVEFAAGCTLEELNPYSGSTYDTPEEIWDAASQLADGASLPGGPYELTGEVTNISTVYSSEYHNITVDIVVDDLTDKPFRCFRLKNGDNITAGEGVEIIAVGDTITVTGEIIRYGNIVEFDSGCKLIARTAYVAPTYDTAEELWDAVNELDDNGILPGGPFEATGVVTEIIPKYTSLELNYISVFIVCDGIEDKPFECFQMINGDAIAEGKGIELLDVGDTITVSGNVQKYVKNGTTTIEFMKNCKLIEIDHIARITSASLSLSDSIAINFKVNENEFDTTKYIPALKVTFAGEETALGAVKKGTDYVFTFGELAPDQMTEIASAQLYLLEVSGSGLNEGIEAGSKDYSIAQYCYNQLRKDTNATNTEFLKVLVDLLKYGDAAMEYTGKTGTKPTSELTEAELALGSDGDPDVSEFGDKQIHPEDGGVVWKGAGLNLTDSIMIRVKFQAALDEDGLYVVYMDNDENNIHLETTSSNFMAVPGADNTYYAFFALPSPLELLTEFTFTMENAYEEVVYGDELVYSAGAYVKSMLSKTTDAKLAALLNAMTNYCLSVIDYVG